jgi:Domain of Unknown Function (DUF1080)
MHQLKFARWGCVLVALALIGCAGAQPTAVPGTPTVETRPSEKLAPSLVPSTPTKLPIPSIVPTSSAVAEWNFDADPVGGLPKGAIVFSGTWAVRAENDAPSAPNALCQTGNATFPALSLGDAVYSDFATSVSFKPISGNTDRAAGIIFRTQDKDNYYIVRANALENNVIIFKYVRGNRLTISEGAGKVATGQWQELGVEVSGNRIRGLVNGAAVVEATDDTFKTAGKIGLWTKADSVTCFDNVQVKAK